MFEPKGLHEPQQFVHVKRRAQLRAHAIDQDFMFTGHMKFSRFVPALNAWKIANIRFDNTPDRQIVNIIIANANARRSKKYAGWSFIDMAKANAGNDAAQSEAEILSY